MSQSFVRIVVFVSFAVLAAPGFAQTDYVATIEPGQVVGGTTSTASGAATLQLNAAQDALTYSIVLVGLDLDGLQTPGTSNDDVTAMHFHLAPPGSNGGIVFGLIAPNDDTDDLVVGAAAGTLDGIWENTDPNALSGQLTNLNAGNLYLNVHTVGFPGGEIRGQVEVQVFTDGFESGNTAAWTSMTPP